MVFIVKKTNNKTIDIHKQISLPMLDLTGTI